MENVRIRVADTIYLDFLDEKPVTEWIKELSKYASEPDTEISFQDDDYTGRELFINIYRDETDEELEARVKREMDWKKSREEREYETYLSLKKKFENDKTDSTVQDS